MKTLVKAKGALILTAVFLLTAGSIIGNCADTTGGHDPACEIGSTLSGIVTNGLTGSPLSGVKVTTDPAIDGVSIETDASGNYTAMLPTGIYTLTFEKSNFESFTKTVVAVDCEKVIEDVALKPTSPVVVNAGKDQAASPGETVTLKATVEPLDGSTVTDYKWTQTAGPAATVGNPNPERQAATVTLADLKLYRTELFKKLRTIDRFMVQAINPRSLEEVEETTFKVTVTTSSGSYSDTLSVTAHLPYATNTGIQNVPVNVPVLLHGKTQDAYSWDLKLPAGSSTALDDSSVQNPSFTPDVAGKYILTETNSGAAFDVYAGTWMGIITGYEEKNKPVTDTSCTTCHNGTIAPDKFSAWKRSGHAEIVTQNIDNPSGHWSIGCASCHTVGYDTEADNNAFDEIMTKEGWEAPQGAVGNWTKMLADYPSTARLANIQCENCHGPQQSTAHMQASARTSLSSDVCGTCHGEPPRHARFQQWEESKHADYTLAIERATNKSCGRCHVGQGFLAWLPQIEAGNPGSIEAEITWTADTTHPVTCVVCHDPHDPGNTSGEPNTATVRIEGNTPMLPAGFKALGVGRGALCMTCHNTRNSERNDVAMLVVDDRAPHTASQADLLMGENAYFVSVGKRSAHSLIGDTCTKCHMQLSPPPAKLSHNLAGTNHSFEASRDVCTSCHGDFVGGGLDEAVHGGMEELKAGLEQAIVNEIVAQISAGNTVTLKKMGADETDVNITKDSSVTALEFTESHGRLAMNIIIGDTTYEHVRLARDTEVKDSGGNVVGTLINSAAGQIIAKAGWNYFLIEGDGSEGVHNPSFTLEVLNASIYALK